jgi:hypothetical protein
VLFFPYDENDGLSADLAEYFEQINAKIHPNRRVNFRAIILVGLALQSIFE